MWERIFTILRKEFRSVFRDPRMRMVIFGLPVIQTLLFGYAVTLDVRHVRLVVIDRDLTPASRALVARFTGSGYFDVVLWTDSEFTVTPAADAASISASVVAGPFCDEMRNTWSSPVTPSTCGSRRSASSHPSGAEEKLTSMTFLPGIDAFSLSGESSAFSSP